VLNENVAQALFVIFQAKIMPIPYSLLIRSVHSFCVNGEPFVAMFKAYIDESADSQDKLFVVGGFIAKYDVWERLELDWLAALPAYLEYFHATECFSGSKQFTGIGEKDREDLLHQLTNMIIRRDMHLIAYSLPKAEYQKHAPRPKKNTFLGNKYLAPFSGVIETACQYAISPNAPVIPTKTDRVTAFFVEDSTYTDGAKQLLREMKKDRSLWWRMGIGTDTYGSKSGSDAIPLLQVADLGAFLAAKKLGNSPQGVIPWEPFHRKLDNAGRIHKLVEITSADLAKFKDCQSSIEL
jgi:hypothetical protein